MVVSALDSGTGRGSGRIEGCQGILNGDGRRITQLERIWRLINHARRTDIC